MALRLIEPSSTLYVLHWFTITCCIYLMTSMSSIMFEPFDVISTKKSFSIGWYTYLIDSVSMNVHYFPVL